jgi:hypothetical protein
MNGRRPFILMTVFERRSVLKQVQGRARQTGQLVQAKLHSHPYLDADGAFIELPRLEIDILHGIERRYVASASDPPHDLFALRRELPPALSPSTLSGGSS